MYLTKEFGQDELMQRPAGRHHQTGARANRRGGERLFGCEEKHSKSYLSRQEEIIPFKI